MPGGRRQEFKLQSKAVGLESWSRWDCSVSFLSHLSCPHPDISFGVQILVRDLWCEGSLWCTVPCEGLGLDVPVPSWDLQCQTGTERKRREILGSGQGIVRHKGKAAVPHGQLQLTTGLTTCDQRAQLCHAS